MATLVEKVNRLCKMSCVCKSCPNKINWKVSKKRVPNVSYFRFPKDTVLLQKWITFTGGIGNFHLSNARICSNHFKSEDLIENVPFKLGFSSVRWYLRPGAVPCIATEEDLAREKERLENKNKEYRKKLVDLIISGANPESLSETNIDIKENTDTDEITDVALEESLSETNLDIKENTDTDEITDVAIEESLSETNIDIKENTDTNEITDVPFEESLCEPFMVLKENTDTPMSDPIGTELETPLDQNSRISYTESESECSMSDSDNLNETQEGLADPKDTEEINDERGLYKEINILLQRYKMKGATQQLGMILEIKREFCQLYIQTMKLREKENELHLAIDRFNESIERDKAHLNHLKEQLEECQPFEFPSNSKSRRKRLWTRFEIETALEEFLRNGRLYCDRFKTECIPSIKTLQRWRRQQYPNKKKSKYKLFCQEDTIERGVKNLGFEVEKPNVREIPALFPDVIPNPQFIFPENNPERGVADLLDPKILELNGITIF